MSDFVIFNGILTKYTGNGGDVVIPEGVTDIGNSAFVGCKGLVSIGIPEGVTSIGSAAFYDCSSLSNIVIPESVISIGTDAFKDCISLTSVTIPESVTSIGYSVFEETNWLKQQDDCVIVNGILIKYQGKMTNVIIPEGVTSIGYGAFSGCSSLKSVTLPDSVTEIKPDAFAGCRGLESIVFSPGLIQIGHHAFYECCSLKKVTLPDSVTEIGWGAFGKCTELESIIFSKNLRIIDVQVFSGCCKLTDVKIPENVTRIEEGAFCRCIALEKISIPERVTELGNYVFYECAGVTSITLPESLNSIGEQAFEGWSCLTSITIPKNCTSIGNSAFERCTALSSITTETKLTAKMFGKKLMKMAKENRLNPLTVNDCSMLPNDLKPYAAVGFAENPDDLKSVRSKSHIKYIKSNAEKLVDYALEHVSLLHLMLENKLLTPGVTEIYLTKAQECGYTEAIAMLLDYQQNKLTHAEKKKAADKAEAREEKITEFVFGAENMEQLQGRVFVVTGNLKTFSSRDEFKACLDACGAVLSETLNEQTDYLITNTPDSGSAKNKKAEQIGVKKLTEAEFNRMIGREQL